jgi:hypothetical protein
MVIVTGSVLVVVAKTVYCTPIVPLGWVVSVLMPVGIEMVTDVAAACTGTMVLASKVTAVCENALPISFAPVCIAMLV